MLKSIILNNKLLRIPILISKRIFILNFLKNKKFILSRTACLGNDSINIAFSNYTVINYQKLRIDYLYNILNNNESIKFSSLVNKYIERTDIYELYIQQFLHKWVFKKNKPFCIIFDSYSELTDQKFIYKLDNKKFFFSNYSDLNHDFENDYNCIGLINTNELYNYYLDVFTKLSLYYAQAPIVFIIFPKKLDTRIKFKERHNEIKNAIYLVKKHIKDLSIIDIPENLVNHNEKDNFPYHFSSETYTYVSDKLKEIININAIKC
jgi:hypothetical protein